MVESTETASPKAPELRMGGFVLDSPEPRALAAFYERLLGWPRSSDEPTWITLVSPTGRPNLSFQFEPEYQRPTWPARSGVPGMMAHLDIGVDDLAPAVEHALAAGAALADFQPQNDVRVMLDPDGHPFCLFVE
jgi:catechol 2,3-dioxygenase-like lactoylglutathione lyase family enzyme